MSGSVSLPDLIKAIRGQIPKDKCDQLEELVQRLQNREVHLNRQQFLHKVRDIAGEDAPALRLALKQLAVDRPRGAGGDGGAQGLDPFSPSAGTPLTSLNAAANSPAAAPGGVLEAGGLSLIHI